MDFERVIETISRFLVSHDHPFAVIGGISMAAYGMVRTTVEDIRFLLTLDGVDRDEVRGYFEKHELARLYAEIG